LTVNRHVWSAADPTDRNYGIRPRSIDELSDHIRLERLQENVAANDLELTSGDLAGLQTILDQIDAGAPYQDHIERMINLSEGNEHLRPHR